MTGGVKNSSEWSPAYEMDDVKWEYQQINTVRKNLGMKPLSYQQYKVLEKSSLPRHLQVEKDLEEVLGHYHQQLGLEEPIRSNSWGMVKYVNRHLAGIYARRTGSANRPYPRLLAYVFTVYFISLHKYYPHIVHKIRRICHEHLKTEKNIKRFESYVKKFLAEGSGLLLQQYL